MPTIEFRRNLLRAAGPGPSHILISTGSITDGIALGIMAYVIGSCVVGRHREISTTMWVLFAIFLSYFAINALLY